MSESTEIEIDPEQHEAEVGAMPHGDAIESWKRWKSKPTPESMAAALKTVKPILDKSVSRFPKYNPAIMGGEAKRLAISAIKTYDPSKGTALSTHVYSHLKSLNRYAADLGTAVRKTRLERDRTADYLGAVRDLTEINNREPSDDELRDHLMVDRKTLHKMRVAATGEVAEGQLESLPGQEEDPRLGLWTNYVYHDLDPVGKLIMDYKLGRNGRKQLGTEETAAKLGMHPDYVNRRAGDIARKILTGADSTHLDTIDPEAEREKALVV